MKIVRDLINTFALVVMVVGGVIFWKAHTISFSNWNISQTSKLDDVLVGLVTMLIGAIIIICREEFLPTEEEKEEKRRRIETRAKERAEEYRRRVVKSKIT